MMARVVDLLQPAGQLAIKFLQRSGALAGQTQASFKILLQGPEHPFHFAPAPRLARFGVNEADAQVGANDLEMVIDEGSAVVGIEFSRKSPAAQSFLEATQQSLGIGGQAIGSKRNQARVIIND